MFYADWITDGILWWSTQLWYFMRWLPPYDWIESPQFELKIALYVTPIMIFYLLPWILYLRSRGKVSRLNSKKVTFIQNSFHCPHCGYVPEYTPANGAYHCPKCGKSSRKT